MNILRINLAAGWLVVGLSGWTWGQTPAPPEMPPSPPASRPAAPQELNKKVQELNRQLEKLFQEKKYPQVIEVSGRLIELLPQKPEGYYSLACGQARLGQKKEALKSLETCVTLGFSDPAFMDKDEDLASLHGDPKYGELLAKAKENDLKSEQAAYEQGEEIAGVKTVEGKPAGGLRYRLRMSPNATAEKPNRLIVWLHPAGNSMNKSLERMSPELNQRGFALAVFTQKNFAAWTEPEIQKVLATLAKMSEVKGIDAQKPILFGFGVGGQAALWVMQQNTFQLGGLVLDEAYPVVNRQGTDALMPPAQTVPVLVLVGENDKGAEWWKAAEKLWIPRGVPLTVRSVPGRAHGWLFDQTQREALFNWLANLKLPASHTAK